MTSDGRDGAREEARRWVRRKLSNLAAVLHDQGDLDHACPLYERALAISRPAWAPTTPDTVRSRENLALVVAALENRL